MQILKMQVPHDNIVTLVSTIDDCFMLEDKDSTCKIEVISRKERKLRLTRELKCGQLFIVVGNDEKGQCGYIDRCAHKNTASSTMAQTETVSELEFDASMLSGDTIDEVKSKLREVIKFDMHNARKN